jgi:hypothetical protein
MAGSAGTLSEAGSGGEGGVVGGCDNQLLINGDFEQGHRGWTEDSNFTSMFQIVQPGSAPGLAEYGVTPQAGRYLGWLGGIPDNNEQKKYRTTLKQTVIIPDEATSITLTGHIWIATEEAEPEMDYMVAEIGEAVDGDNNLDVCWLAQWWWNGTTTSGWVPFTYTTSFACVRGTRVFRLESRQDPEVETSFFVDSLRLVAACGR